MSHYRWCIFSQTSGVSTPWEEYSTEVGSKIQATRGLNKLTGVNLAVVQHVDLNQVVVEQWHKTRYRQWKRVTPGAEMAVEPKSNVRKRRNQKVTENKPVKITRKVIRQVAIQAWKKYPQAFTDPNYQLGEMTLALVEQEIRQKLDDLRRGIVVKQATLKDYFN